jgi:hypothetical protein
MSTTAESFRWPLISKASAMVNVGQKVGSATSTIQQKANVDDGTRWQSFAEACAFF